MQPIELIIFSDFHAHAFGYGSKWIPHPDSHREGLYNSRLIDCVHVLREIKTYAKENNIKIVLFGGDLFHRRQSVKTAVFSTIFREFVSLAASVDDVVMIPGNHDYGDRKGFVHSLESFGQIPNVRVTGSGVGFFTKTNQFNVVTVPYTDDLDTARERLKYAGELAEVSSDPSILLAHLGMQGAKVGSDYVLVSKGDVEVGDVPNTSFLGCFFGHYHQHQKLFSNGWYIGATHHHNWGDASTKRGFLHVRIDEGGISFKQVETSAPRFINIKAGEEDAIPLRPQDFVRYHYRSDAGSIDVDRLDEELGVSHVEPIEHTEDKEEPLEIPEDSLNPAALIDSWVDYHVVGDLRKPIADLGKALLAEAEGKML